MYAKAKSLTQPVWEKVSIRILFFALAAILIGVFALYAYLVHKTIMNVVAREKVEHDISSLSTTIGEQEFKFITMRNNITLDLAYSKGFHDATPSQFITRNNSALSYNSH